MQTVYINFVHEQKNLGNKYVSCDLQVLFGVYVCVCICIDFVTVFKFYPFLSFRSEVFLMDEMVLFCVQDSLLVWFCLLVCGFFFVCVSVVVGFVWVFCLVG